VAARKTDPFDETYLAEIDAMLQPEERAVIQETVEKKSKPALVLMNLAHDIILKEENENP